VAAWGGAKLAGDPVIGKEDCWALRRGQLHVVEGPGSRLLCEHLIVPPAGASLCAPITGQGDLLGMLHVQLGAEEAHPPTQVRQRRLASQQAWCCPWPRTSPWRWPTCGCARACARRRCAIHSPACTTAATWSWRWNAKCCAPRSGRRSVGVIMLDLDHLKNFNDKYGHEAGDMLIRTLGDYLVTHVRAKTSPAATAARSSW
jgi:hypothetical protein